MAAYNFISLGFRLICDINQTPDAIHASVSFASSVYLFFLVVALSVGRFYSPVSFATSLLFMAVLFNPAARAYAFWGLLLIGFYTLAATYTAWNDALLNRAFTQYGQTRRRRAGVGPGSPPPSSSPYAPLPSQPAAAQWKSKLEAAAPPAKVYDDPMCAVCMEEPNPSLNPSSDPNAYAPE